MWQQPQEITNKKLLDINNNDSLSQTTQENQKLANTQMFDLAIQTSPPKRFQPQNLVFVREQAHESQTGNEPLPFLNRSSSCYTDIQVSENHIMTNLNSDTNILPLKITTSYPTHWEKYCER